MFNWRLLLLGHAATLLLFVNEGFLRYSSDASMRWRSRSRVFLFYTYLHRGRPSRSSVYNGDRHPTTVFPGRTLPFYGKVNVLCIWLHDAHILLSRMELTTWIEHPDMLHGSVRIFIFNFKLFHSKEIGSRLESVSL